MDNSRQKILYRSKLGMNVWVKSISQPKGKQVLISKEVACLVKEFYMLY